MRALRECFSLYEAGDVVRGLVATMGLFRRLATDLAVRLELPYPARADAAATSLVVELLEPARLRR